VVLPACLLGKAQPILARTRAARTLSGFQTDPLPVPQNEPMPWIIKPLLPKQLNTINGDVAAWFSSWLTTIVGEGFIIARNRLKARPASTWMLVHHPIGSMRPRRYRNRNRSGLDRLPRRLKGSLRESLRFPNARSFTSSSEGVDLARERQRTSAGESRVKETASDSAGKRWG
jgi:hypothetical protein